MNFAVEVKCQEICEALQKLAFAKGYTWQSSENVRKVEGYTHLLLEEYPAKRIYNDNYKDKCVKDKYKLLSLDEFIKEFSLLKIKVGSNEVEFTPDGIKVGCQSVPKDLMFQIVEQWKKIYQAS